MESGVVLQMAPGPGDLLGWPGEKAQVQLGMALRWEAMGAEQGEAREAEAILAGVVRQVERAGTAQRWEKVKSPLVAWWSG
jgi:hypothetical protein